MSEFWQNVLRILAVVSEVIVLIVGHFRTDSETETFA